MSKSLIPQNDRVLIKPLDEGEQMYGNIVIPDMGKEKPEIGEVLAVGPGRMSEFGKYVTVQAKVGDVVLVPKIGTLRFDYDGEEYYIIQDKEILATINEDK
jgi:chaperonin GroES|tara:strand:- start:3281 stop:3583 length:303 start_codon:yes stop_codon:yes gene_type:complete